MPSRCRPPWWNSEFASIWAQVEEELKREGKTAADEGKTEDELKAEYRAHRRAPRAPGPGAGQAGRAERHHHRRR